MHVFEKRIIVKSFEYDEATPVDENGQIKSLKGICSYQKYQIGGDIRMPEIKLMTDFVDSKLGLCVRAYEHFHGLNVYWLAT